MSRVPMYYGLVSQAHAVDIAKAVCSVLGYGKNAKAADLILETAAQETHLGAFKDPTPYGAGTGLCQVDLVSFLDTRNRTRDKHKLALHKAFGINIDRLEYRELENSPLLSFIFCRLHYLLKPEIIPSDLAGRALYWKKHYNTEAGKGKPSEYIENARRYLGGE